MPKIEMDYDAKIAVYRGLSGASFTIALATLNYSTQSPAPTLTLISAMLSMALAFMLWRSY